MKILATPLILLAAACASVPPTGPGFFQVAEIPSWKLDVQVGLRSFDEGDWTPVDDQSSLGLALVHEDHGSVVGLEAAVFTSEWNEDQFFVSPTTTVDARGRTRELCFGVHKSIPVVYAGVHPYFGGGFSLLRAEIRGASGSIQDEDHDGSAGIYLHGGVDFDLSPNLFIGIDLRARGGSEIRIFGDDLSADYGQVAFVLGVRL